jgi:hypothetical protein
VKVLLGGTLPLGRDVHAVAILSGMQSVHRHWSAGTVTAGQELMHVNGFWSKTSFG